MKVGPQREHAWLQRLVGDWVYEGEAPAAPGEPVMRISGTETVRGIGEVWIVAEGRGAMPDGALATTLLTLGYDPARQRFVGTWLGSMMTHLWLYEGALDPHGKVLTLGSEGPDVMSGGTQLVQYEDVVEVVSDDERLLRSRMLGDSGTWREIMTSRYRRKA